MLTNSTTINLINTITNVQFVYDSGSAMLGLSTPFSSSESLYLSNLDILIVAGNGAYAILNATSPKYQNNIILVYPSHQTCLVNINK